MEPAGRVGGETVTRLFAVSIRRTTPRLGPMRSKFQDLQPPKSGPLSMSPNVLAVVVALTGFQSFFGAFYLNIRRAKKRVSHWKPGSSYLFIRSNGLSGVKTRATRVWIKELGYEEPEVLIIARYQECMIVMTIAGIIALAVISRVWPGVDFRRLC
jgi:hypothetical protein